MKLVSRDILSCESKILNPLTSSSSFLQPSHTGPGNRDFTLCPHELDYYSTSHKGNHTVSVPLLLAHFTQYNVLIVQSLQRSSVLEHRTSFHYMYYIYFTIYILKSLEFHFFEMITFLDVFVGFFSY